MDRMNERCAICGEPIESDDKKVFCPDCGAPMHDDCFQLAGKCPNNENHITHTVNTIDFTNISEPKKKRTMHLYPDGDGCEICGKPFSETDEKVFCPECGASMHRLCYSMTHTCPYIEEHGNKAEIGTNTSPAVSSEPVCDICGNKLDNGEEIVYCPECGTPVHSLCWEKTHVCPNEARHASGYDWESDHRKRSRPEQEIRNTDLTMRSISFENFPQMIMENPIRSSEDGEELTCYGVKQSELLHFLGYENFSTPRFLTLFLNMANSGKVFSINLSAWFFAPFYHFYRRMTGPAIILSLATFILMVPTLLLELLYWSNSGNNVVNDPLANAATVTSYIMILVRVLILIFSDYIYMRWSVNKILTLRERYKDATTDEYYAALEHSGNPRMLYVLGGISLMMFLVYLLNIFIAATGMIS